MADSQKHSSYQALGGGVYRVVGVHRSAVTGRYVTSAAAKRAVPAGRERPDKSDKGPSK